jgi:hypothetical protein
MVRKPENVRIDATVKILFMRDFRSSWVCKLGLWFSESGRVWSPYPGQNKTEEALSLKC